MMANDDDTTTETSEAPEEGVEKVEPTHADAEEQANAEDFAETFKTAAQKVLEDRFGMQQNEDGSVDFTKLDSEAVKANAQALIGGLMSQLAGVTPPQAEATTEPPPPTDPDDNVIDLEAARRARAGRQPSELERRISQSFKMTFDDYMQEHFVPEGSEGSVDLKLDGEVLREHGPQLLTALFGAFSKSLFPEDGVQVTVGGQAPEADDAEATDAEATGEEGADTEEAGEATAEGPANASGRVDVNINVDLAGMFRGLLEGVKPKS